MRFRRHAEGDGRGLNYSEATDLDVKEVVSGVFFPMRGIRQGAEFHKFRWLQVPNDWIDVG